MAGRDVRRGKPDPEVYLTTAERLGVAPGACVVFEDAPVGIEAARRAGMRAVGVATTCHAETLQAAASQTGAQAFPDAIAMLETARRRLLSARKKNGN